MELLGPNNQYLPKIVAVFAEVRQTYPLYLDSPCHTLHIVFFRLLIPSCMDFLGCFSGSWSWQNPFSPKSVAFKICLK